MFLHEQQDWPILKPTRKKKKTVFSMISGCAPRCILTRRKTKHFSMISRRASPCNLTPKNWFLMGFEKAAPVLLDLRSEKNHTNSTSPRFREKCTSHEPPMPTPQQAEESQESVGCTSGWPRRQAWLKLLFGQSRNGNLHASSVKVFVETSTSAQQCSIFKVLARSAKNMLQITIHAADETDGVHHAAVKDLKGEAFFPTYPFQTRNKKLPRHMRAASRNTYP